MANEKKNWIVGIHNSEGDYTFMYRVYGTAYQVKRHLVSLVKEDRGNDPESWEYGTEKIADVDDQYNCQKDGMYACGCYSDYHIDYSAVPESEPKKL